MAQSELEPLRKRLREKEVDLEASARTLESQKAQTQRWERRVSQVCSLFVATKFLCWHFKTVADIFRSLFWMFVTSFHM